MGYRTYIGKISKDKYNEIKDLSLKDLAEKLNVKYSDDDLYIPTNKLVETLYECGKYTDFDDSQYYSTFFSNEETNEAFCNSDTEFYLTNKEYFALIINSYKDKVKSYYDSIVKPFHSDSDFIKSMKYLDGRYTFDYSLLTHEQSIAIFKALDGARSMSSEWEIDNFNLEFGDEVTTSWKYEYSIFELIRLYKTFDWENDLLVYYGY